MQTAKNVLWHQVYAIKVKLLSVDDKSIPNMTLAHSGWYMTSLLNIYFHFEIITKSNFNDKNV